MTQAAQLAQYGANNVGLSFKNRIINGDMTISQRNGTSSVTTNSGYTTDRWQTFSNAGTRTLQQVADAPAGFVNSLKMTTTSASAGAVCLIQQWIEGFNTADMGFGTANASTITVSFWVKSSLTGLFAGDIANAVSGSPNRSYVFTYTINSANTWEQKTITIPGDTTGTWATDNTAGMRLLFNLGTGGTAGTAGTWAAGDLIRTTSSIGIDGTSGASWQVTGVQLEKGTVATSFDYLPYGTELALCQRYFQIYNSATNFSSWGAGRQNNTTTARIFANYPTMRANPTLALGGSTVIDIPGTSLTISSISAQYLGHSGGFVDFNTPSGGATGYGASVQMSNSGGLANFVSLAAEL